MNLTYLCSGDVNVKRIFLSKKIYSIKFFKKNWPPANTFKINELDNCLDLQLFQESVWSGKIATKKDLRQWLSERRETAQWLQNFLKIDSKEF